MVRSPATLFELSRRALGTTQAKLGAMLGVSRRTAQRWTSSGVPSYHMPDLARLVHPADPLLASEIAAAAGTTLEALGVVAPPPPPPPVLPPPRPEPPAAPLPPSLPPDSFIDAAVVCAAAEAMSLLPGEVRVGVHAAFARASELNLPPSVVERALRARLPADAVPPATAPAADAPRPRRRDGSAAAPAARGG